MSSSGFTRRRPAKSPSAAIGLRRAGERVASLRKPTMAFGHSPIGPLVPDFYSYSFMVDGVRTIDPKNPMIKQGELSLDNMFLVDGEDAAYEANEPVPHGEIRIDWYRSNVLDKIRGMHVYTPPGYEGSKGKYPV